MIVKVLLDFDGVLFDSAREVYNVCQRVSNQNSSYRDNVDYEQFLRYRAKVTDAWQFYKLYTSDLEINDCEILFDKKPTNDELNYASDFFLARRELMNESGWERSIEPFNFFFEVKKLIEYFPQTFSILSTRNFDSIAKIMEYHGIVGLPIYGQEDVKKYGSKLGVAKFNNIFSPERFVIYIDDMASHLEPFVGYADLLLQANWGYDSIKDESYTQKQIYKILDSAIQISTV